MAQYNTRKPLLQCLIFGSDRFLCAKNQGCQTKGFVEIDGQYWIYCTVLNADYTANDDGTYTCRGNTYKYMIEVSGVDGESQITYIILTNDKETDFEDVRYRPCLKNGTALYYFNKMAMAAI